MAMLAPDVAILDETDSGLDIDALRTVAEGVQRLHDEQGLGALIITHYQRILHYVKPEFVHILMDGRIVLEGGVELVERLEREGYDQIRQEVGASVAEPCAGAAGRERRRTARRNALYARAAPAQVKPGATARRRSTTRWPAPARRRAHARAAARGGARGFEAPSCPCGGARASGRRASRALDLDALDARSRRRRRPGVRAGGRRAHAPRAPARRAARAERAARSCTSSSTRRSRERGVILCSLEDAFREHPELVAPWYSKRLTIDRHKLEAANAAFWSGGAFLHVPAGLVVEEPFEIVYAIDAAGRRAVRAHARRWASRRSEFRVHEYDLAEDFEGQALHAGAFELYLQDGARCRLAQLQDWGAGEVFDVSTRFVGVGRDAYCHWLPALLGGHLVRQHLELAVTEPGGDMAFRGLFFTEEHEHLDVFAVDLHETGPLRRRRALARRRDRREPRELRGPDPDRPGRAADAHLPADPLDDALAEGAPRRDPLGARLRRRRLGLARRHGRRARRGRRSSTCRRAASTARRPCA